MKTEQISEKRRMKSNVINKKAEKPAKINSTKESLFEKNKLKLIPLG